MAATRRCRFRSMRRASGGPERERFEARSRSPRHGRHSLETLSPALSRLTNDQVTLHSEDGRRPDLTNSLAALQQSADSQCRTHSGVGNDVTLGGFGGQVWDVTAGASLGWGRDSFRAGSACLDGSPGGCGGCVGSSGSRILQEGMSEHGDCKGRRIATHTQQSKEIS